MLLTFGGCETEFRQGYTFVYSPPDVEAPNTGGDGSDGGGTGGEGTGGEGTETEKTTILDYLEDGEKYSVVYTYNADDKTLTSVGDRIYKFTLFQGVTIGAFMNMNGSGVILAEVP